MKLSKCPLCDHIKALPIHVTEIKDGKAVESYSLCFACAKVFLGDDDLPQDGSEPKLQPETEGMVIDLSTIETPEQLLDFIAQHEAQIDKKCDKCGITWAEFDREGRFGCPHCYESFSQEIEAICQTYHGDTYHVGKRPKRWVEEQMADPKEKLKLLKLQLAKAIELEHYEEAAKFKEQIEQLPSD